jgi:hypothetical protein
MLAQFVNKWLGPGQPGQFMHVEPVPELSVSGDISGMPETIR